MKDRKWIMLVVALAMIAGAAIALSRLKAIQKLGSPGIVATPIPGSPNMSIDLPARVLDFISTNLPTSDEVLSYLPKDTSYAQRLYQAPDGFWVNANIVLQGADRTSIHKPDYCIPGHGWVIVDKSEAPIEIGGPHPYTLTVSKWKLRNTVKQPNGEKLEVSGLYVFWFVADNEQTPSYARRRTLLMLDLLRKGVLQRWAYVMYFTSFLPGHEDEVFERLKKLIAASVPEFQLPPRSAAAPAVASQ